MNTPSPFAPHIDTTCGGSGQVGRSTGRSGGHEHILGGLAKTRRAQSCSVPETIDALDHAFQRGAHTILKHLPLEVAAAAVVAAVADHHGWEHTPGSVELLTQILIDRSGTNLAEHLTFYGDELTETDFLAAVAATSGPVAA